MYIKTILPLLLLLFISSSCIRIATPEIVGFVSKYKKTDREYPGLLVRTNPTESVCNITVKDTPQVYIINAKQINNCLNKYQKSIVYIWDPHCTAESCISPTLLQSYCDLENIELFVVIEYYDGAELSQYYDLKHPIFGIDTQYYKTDFTDRYRKLFEKDLCGQNNSYSRMIYFENGEYMGSAEFSKSTKVTK